ncbi:hypothetical protein GCM10010912_28500 [Paenibacillus albidus]|uniref:Uncharacterized protein n=1 Tax=Paenibacillus albidus TaxID=2041023 RepID=A0A917CAB2_9BACL|nr:hypothetical protein GCM10010912_28500 [Paenibacillus albidus]
MKTPNERMINRKEILNAFPFAAADTGPSSLLKINKMPTALARREDINSQSESSALIKEDIHGIPT